MSLGTQLIVDVVVHVGLFGAPFAAGMLVGSRWLNGLAGRVAVGMLTSGLAAYATFWLYFADPVAGKAASWAVPLVSLVVIAWRGARHRRVVLEAVVLLATVGAASLFNLALAFAHGGLSAPVASATTRFSHPLPGDNQLPQYFGEWYYVHGHATPPPFGDWLSSDRPPLEVGYYLAHRPFFGGFPELDYQVLGVILQSTWVVGVLALLAASRIRRVPAMATVVAVAVSDVVFVHTAFVWPKLLPAAFLIAAAALLLSPEWSRIRGRTSGALVVAVLAALAMLGHGSTLFPLVGLAMLMLFRGLPSARWTAAAAVTGVFLLGTWSAYQHWADPPGNRLLKWQLAGQTAITPTGTGSSILNAYRDVGWEGAAANKVTNLRTTLWSPNLIAALDEKRPAARVIEARRLDAFFSLVPSLGLLLLGPVIALARIRKLDRGLAALAGLSLAAGALSALVSCLLLFGGADSVATVHVSSLAAPLFLLVGCVAAAFAGGPRVALLLVVGHVALQLVVYTPPLSSAAGTHWSVSMLVAATASLLCVAGLSALISGPRAWGDPSDVRFESRTRGRNVSA